MRNIVASYSTNLQLVELDIGPADVGVETEGKVLIDVKYPLREIITLLSSSDAGQEDSQEPFQ